MSAHKQDPQSQQQPRKGSSNQSFPQDGDLTDTRLVVVVFLFAASRRQSSVLARLQGLISPPVNSPGNSVHAFGRAQPDGATATAAFTIPAVGPTRGSKPTTSTAPRSNHAPLSSTTAASPPLTAKTYTAGPVPSSNNRRRSDLRELKVRILTWNMHDALPKGDLQELFGRIPVYDPTEYNANFPILPSGSGHPYHLVVVAGQECPTSSGIPMGLAAGFKIYDSDKSRESERELDKIINEEKEEERLLHDIAPTGWTHLVEEWLCNGEGSVIHSSFPPKGDVSPPRPLVKRKSFKGSKKGPYQLLVKDRLMGIYMAIYIHRDLRPFVQGVSKDTVAAGLIGGRVGNKGGVGISLNIDGTTFFFLNAHLAGKFPHEGRVQHRLANLAKIKAELSIEDFLPNDDPRKLAQDLTDKFDFTFIFGDLNFRLDISRLHADWLIAQKEYTQAFEFDQLHKIMVEGHHFAGFHEAPIDFPPTFKYDVLRTLKKRKRKKSKPGDKDKGAESDRQDCDRDADDGDTTSVSSIRSSMDSRLHPEPIHDEPLDITAPPITPPKAATAPGLSRRSTFKSRTKWLSLLSPGPGGSEMLKRKKTKSPSTPSTPNTPSPMPPDTPATPKPDKLDPKRRGSRPPPMILVSSTSSSPSSSEQEVVEDEKGVYDSSNKKRVPSWYDRILWKTTIQPFPEELASPNTTLNRMTQFFANTFLPPSARSIQTPTASPVPTKERKGNTPTPPTRRLTSPISPNFFRLLSPRPGNASPKRAKTAFSPPPTAPLPLEHSPPSVLPTPLTSSATPQPNNRPHSAAPSMWRFLPSFLSPTLSQTQSTEPNAPPPPPPPVLRSRGEVVCMSYTTLDDQGMRRLEGRSDHRPVIGCYALYY